MSDLTSFLKNALQEQVTKENEIQEKFSNFIQAYNQLIGALQAFGEESAAQVTLNNMNLRVESTIIPTSLIRIQAAGAQFSMQPMVRYNKSNVSNTLFSVQVSATRMLPDLKIQTLVFNTDSQTWSSPTVKNKEISIDDLKRAIVYSLVGQLP